MKKQTIFPMLILLVFVALGLVFAGHSDWIVRRAENLVAGSSAQAQTEDGQDMQKKSGEKIEKIKKSDEEWREELSSEEYYILRKKGTEQAFTGKYYKHKEDGIYVCAACGTELFSSDAKYESGSGWPSYYKPVSKQNVDTETDMTYGMVRSEVSCARCGGHLGHVFDDGPQPTGLRYCINSVALDFVASDATTKSTGIEESED